ncbi:MAG: hypothetical protein B7X00_00330 [Legionella sp. 21-45-4]|nr:MAG: hypothetical protein B7X00_00330 [Legionella sp. 21-45-4]
MNEGDEAKNIMRTARQLLSDIKTPVDKNDNLELIITSDTDEGVKRLHSAVNFIIATDPKKYEGLRVVPYNSKGQELIIHNSSIMWFIHKVFDVLTTFSLTSTARTVADTRLKKESSTRTAKAEVNALRHGQQTLELLETQKDTLTTNPRSPGP